MPLYSYHCEKCDSDFELLLVRFDSPASCPFCDSEDLTKMPPKPVVLQGAAVKGCSRQNECASAVHNCCDGCRCAK